MNHMTRGLKYSAYVLAGLFVLAVSVVLYLKTLDFNDYKPQIQEAVQQATGRMLHIDGQLTLSVSMHPALVVEGVHLSNIVGGSRVNMVDVERLEFELRLWPLLSGNVYVERLILVRPDILLETLADGTANWAFSAATDGSTAESQEAQQTPVGLPQVHRVMISDAKLSYRDAKTGQTQSLSLPHLQLWEEGKDIAAPLNLSMEGQFNKTPIKLEGQLGSVSALIANEKLDVDLRASIADAQLQMRGSVARPMDGKGVSLDIDLNAPDMAALAKLADVSLGTFPLHLKTMLKDSADGFDLSSLQVNIGSSDVTGDVQLALIEPRPKITAMLQSKHFSLDDILPAKEGDVAPPHADKGSKVDKSKSLLPAEPLDLSALKSVDADITYKAKAFFMPDMQLADVDMRLRLAGGVLSLTPFKANVGNSDMTGDVQLALIEPRPRITAVLQSKHFSLDDILPVKEAETVPPQADKGVRADKPKRLLPAEPLDLDALKLLDADITYKAKAFFMPDMQLADVDMRLRLAGGVLSFVPFKVRFGGGTINSTMSLHGDALPAVIDLAVTGRNIVAEQLLEQGGKKSETPLMEGGSMNVDMQLKGKGRSIAEILGHGNGRIRLSLGKAKVKSDILNMVGGDVVVGLVDKLNPFSESKDYTSVQCGVVHFRLQDGLMVSENGIAVETDRMNVLSEGKINLQDESLDLSIGTEPREGIGVNVSNMVNVVRLGGTLAEPGIRMDIAKSGKGVARVAGALATGGLSLLGEGLFNRVMADSTPCKTALEMK